MSAGAYLLVKFSDKQKLIPAIEAIYDNDNVVNFDAIDGYHHLLVKLAAPNDATVEAIKSLDGFAEMAECVIEKDNQTNYDLDETFTYSYLFLETENGSTESIMNELQSKDVVTFCSPTTGSFNLVALVKGETFDSIDRMIKTEIKNLDGVLRYKKDYVIFLDRI